MSLTAAPSSTAVVADSSVSKYFTAISGVGLSGAGVGLSAYVNHQPWKDPRTFTFQALSKFQRKGTYVATTALTLALCGAELLFAETSDATARSNKVLNDMMAGRPPGAIDITPEKSSLWYTRPFSRDGAPMALWFGLSTLAMDRAGHVGAMQYSRFRHSPFWTGKMMIPLYAGFLYMFVGSVNVKFDEHARRQQESKATMQNLIWRAQESTLRAQQPVRYVGKWRG